MAVNLKNATFGKMYITREGGKAVYLKGINSDNISTHTMSVQTATGVVWTGEHFTDEGKFSDVEHPFDIVGEL